MTAPSPDRDSDDARDDEPLLQAHVVLSRDDFRIDVEVAVARGETLAVVGPNGAGKTTLLRAIAGLDVTTGGHMRINGIDHTDRPTSERPVHVVFQDLRLFPHLDAIDNVAFPSRAAGRPRRAAREDAQRLLGSLGLSGEVVGRRPAGLSGGEAQRVALARALSAEPLVLLLDEPFAALDAASRPAARTIVRERLGRFSGATVLVTHDAADAVVLADRVLVLEDGRATQVGSVAQIARSPRTAYAARLVGTNLLTGHSDGTRVLTDAGLAVTTAEPIPVGAVGVVVPPTAVALHPSPPGGSPRNVWPAVVTAVEVLGSRARITVHTSVSSRAPAGSSGHELVAEVTIASVDALDLRAGAVVFASAKATEIEVVAVTGRPHDA